MPVRTRLRRSNRSVELMRVAALETDSSLRPDGESAEPSGPWKPWVDFATEISAPAGRTAQPAGVTRSLRASAALAGSAARPAASRRRETAREITTFDAVGRTEGTRPLSSPRMRARLRFLPALGTVVGVAVLLKIVYAPWFLNYDARYALLWARDVARGLTPDYEAPFAPTPHPLETLVSLVAVPFGTGGDAIMLWATLLCFGAAGVARLPARRGAVLARGRRGDGARRADAAGARARRPDRLPGHRLRGRDRVGGAAGGAAVPARRAGARSCSRSPG